MSRPGPGPMLETDRRSQMFLSHPHHWEMAATTLAVMVGTIALAGEAQAAAIRAHTPMEILDIQFNLARAAIVVLAGLACSWGIWVRRGADSPVRHGKARSPRLALLALLGIAGYLSYYQFFWMSHAKGFAKADNFVYYVNSKYFDELGYLGLYECSLVALQERSQLPPLRNRLVRDLRSLSFVPLSDALARGADCPARFGPQRWRAFGDDVAWFAAHWPGPYQRAVWLDLGYNATPVWTLIGGALASRVELTDRAELRLLERADRVIVAAALLAVAWAFGIEVAGLAAVLWGTGFLWRYAYLGDAMLRTLWWAAALIGICLLRKGRHGAAGAALALSGALRLFPILLPLCYLVGAGLRAWRERRVPRSALRFVAGAAFTSATLLAAGLLASEKGVAVLPALGAKLGALDALAMPNMMGLGSLTRWPFENAPIAARLVHALLLLSLLPGFLRALRGAADWQAAALGAAFIPLLLEPSSYYFSFIVISALLSATRPRIGLATLIAALAWITNGLLCYRQPGEFHGAAAIAVGLSLFVAWEMGRARGVEAEEDTAPDDSSADLDCAGSGSTASGGLRSTREGAARPTRQDKRDERRLEEV